MVWFFGERNMRRWKNKVGQLKFAFYCFKQSQHPRFMRQVMELENEGNLVKVQGHCGSAGRVYYLIDMDEISTGFFAVFNRMLTLLYFADKHGLTPVIRYGSSFPYAEEHPVNGSSNPYEYYFKQPNDADLEEIMRNECILVSRKENSNLANRLNENGNGYARSGQFIEEMAYILHKYIRLNDVMEEKIKNQLQIFAGKKILGVHVRGTDFKKNYNGHPVRIEVDDYLREAGGIFDAGDYEQIFLATDDAEAVSIFRQKFGDSLIIYEDVIRSDGDDSVMNSNSSRNNHHYLLGLEVLRDMYSLASCSGLVAGLSQVSYAARIQKKSMGEEYQDMIIMDKGINYHQKENCPS